MQAKILCIGFLLLTILPFLQGKSQTMHSTKNLTKQEKQNLATIVQFHSGGSGVIKRFIESGKMTQDVEWYVPGPKDKLPFAGLWTGSAGIAEFNRLLDATMRYDKVEIKEYLVDGDEVAAIFHAEGIALATGKPFNSEILRLYTFKDGKIIRVRNFYDTASYVEAVSK